MVLIRIQLSGFIPFLSELSGSRPDIRALSPSWFRFEGISRVFWDGDMDNAPPEYTLFNLLPPDVARAHVSTLQPSSFAALNGTASYIPYDGKFRSLYIIGARDNAVPPQLARAYVEQEGAEWEVQVIEGDHTPQLSVPDVFVGIVRGFVEEEKNSVLEL
jgi:pimeloyl-ACP methyl ester carboxylesterase